MFVKALVQCERVMLLLQLSHDRLLDVVCADGCLRDRAVGEEELREGDSLRERGASVRALRERALGDRDRAVGEMCRDRARAVGEMCRSSA